MKLETPAACNSEHGAKLAMNAAAKLKEHTKHLSHGVQTEL